MCRSIDSKLSMILWEHSCLSVSAGEMVLLLHWSMLNYAGVVKILKKHGEIWLYFCGIASTCPDFCIVRLSSV